MLEKLLSIHLFTQMGQAVRPLVQIRGVDLEDIAREDHLGAFSGTGDDGFDFVRREVLGLVHDEEHLPQAAAADIGQWRNQQLLFFQQGLDMQRLL